ncbi:histidine phosphatase family protein, partial [Kineococcus indalonis]|uniref:histidine phosphatase family protein n=1 Tax=Kineococcus indalonis TaxID=2696566 RepID=UPI00196B0DC6
GPGAGAAGAAGAARAASAPAAQPAVPAAPAGERGEPLDLVLVRHASTPLTEQRRLSGRCGEDPELSATGREEARRAAASPEVRGADVVVTSTLRRSRQTAEAVAEQVGARLVVDPQWDETDFGDWDGCTAAEVARRWPAEFAAWSDDPSVAPPGGEALVAVEARVREAAAALRARWAGRRVVLVTHGDPLRALLRQCLGCGAHLQRRIHVDPASRTVLRLHADGSSEVLAVNRV